jgi:hypothetical protein
MKILLTDVWNDLRAKRLWPVAVILLAAVVAVPVVLSKASEEPPVTAPRAVQARTAPEPQDIKGLTAVTVAESGPRGSSLNTFDPADPFRPPEKVLEKAEEEQAGTSSGPRAAARGSDSTGSAAANASPGSRGDSGSTSPSPSPSPGTGVPVDTGDTGGSGGSGGDSPDGDAPTTTTQYAYVVDLTFAADGKKRRISGMERLDMLPSEAKPMLLFLGVSPSGGNAVFLVDSTLEAAGEGQCKPSKADCAFLHLGPGSEHEFTNEDGDSYRLRIDEIRKVELNGKARASSKKGKTAAVALAAPKTRRRFVPPVLADLVSLSKGGGDHSNNDRDRR